MLHVKYLKNVLNFIEKSTKIISREIICREVVIYLDIYIVIVSNVSRETYKGSI